MAEYHPSILQISVFLFSEMQVIISIPFTGALALGVENMSVFCAQTFFILLTDCYYDILCCAL